MGKTYEQIDGDLAQWIEQREMFFVSTAPLDENGMVNCSPKGLDTFRIIDPLTVGYVDLIGSGIETAAHLNENGRIVIMFCTFNGPPKIVRLHGVGEYILADSDEFRSLTDRFGEHRGARGLVKVSLKRISDSCGYGVPKLQFVEDREALGKWAEKKSDVELVDYVRETNNRSIDGLPGL